MTDVASTPPTRLVLLPKSGEAREHLLHEEAPDPSPRVDGRENEQRLEHDGKVVPVGQQAWTFQASAEKTRAMPTARETPPPVRAATTSPAARDSEGRSL
jgi:hypothetical protein